MRGVARTPPLAALLVLVMAACQTVTPSGGPEGSAASPRPTASGGAATTFDHRVGIRTVGGRTELFDRQTNQPFAPRGANYLHLERDSSGVVVDRLFAAYDGDTASADLADMQRLGYTSVRIALDICQGDCIGDPAGGLRTDYLANVADLLRRAQAIGLPVLLQSNDLPVNGGYVSRVEATGGSEFDGYLNSQYLSPTGVEVYREYWRDVIDGLKSAGAPLGAVLAWNVRGEIFVVDDKPPLSLRSGSVTTANGRTYDMASAKERATMVRDGLVYWVDEMAAIIRSADPNAIIAIGEFAPNSPTAWRGKDPRSPPRIDVLLGSSVDVLDVHVYPGYVPLVKLMENLGVTGDEPIPVIVGEYGAFTFAFSDPPAGAAGLMQWQVESCRFGIDGWFHWHWRGVGDAEVWTGTEAENAINTTLSPAERPDPCVTRDFPFLRQNLALGAKVTASSSVAGQGSKLAIDGDPGTSWVSGKAPPGWIEISLGRPSTIETIRLTVNQSPPGRTVHTVSAGGSHASLEKVHVFDGATKYGDLLSWTPSAPLTGVSVIRIQTSVSPSWVAWLEIEIVGRPD